METDFNSLKEKALELLRRKKSRDIIILVFLLFVMLWILIPLLLQGKKIFKRLRVVECRECRKKEVRDVEVHGLGTCECAKCGGNFEYVYKCLECDYEFPFVRRAREDIPGFDKMTKKQYMEYRINESRCPNCGSIFTDPKVVVPDKPQKKE